MRSIVALLVLLGASLHETAGFQAASFARGPLAHQIHGASGVRPSPSSTTTVARHVQPFGGPGEGEEIPQEVCDAEARSAPGRQIRVGIAGGVAVISAALAVLQEVLPGGTPAILDSPAAAAAEGVLAVGACLLIQQEYGERASHSVDVGDGHARSRSRSRSRIADADAPPPTRHHHHRLQRPATPIGSASFWSSSAERATASLRRSRARRRARADTHGGR